MSELELDAALLLAGPVGVPAIGAVPVDAAELEKRLRLLVEAPRTEIVDRLWMSFVLGPCRLWRDVGAIDEYPGTQLEKAVSTEIRKLFLEFSNRLSQGRMLLLQLHELPVAGDDLRLQVEQFLRHVCNGRAGLGEVVNVDGRLGERHGAGQARKGSSDE